ncbi:MAG TPA: hypothetical protein VKX17_25685 [Planctomycetota bacterium]|nr:hypothetical protein [Planctomycetota bacterium]
MQDTTNDTSELRTAPAEPLETDTTAADAPGIFAELGALPAGAIVNETALARIFGRHTESVKRAIDRGELPAPARMFGSNCWTAGAIVRHLERRLEAAAKEQERKERTIKEHCA